MRLLNYLIGLNSSNWANNSERSNKRQLIPADKLVTKHIKTIRKNCTMQTNTRSLEEFNWIINHQFGYRQSDNNVAVFVLWTKCFENWHYCTGKFLDVSQAFSKA